MPGSGVKPVGYALSGCTHDFLSFVVMEDSRVKVNYFYFIDHPSNPDLLVLRMDMGRRHRSRLNGQLRSCGERRRCAFQDHP